MGFPKLQETKVTFSINYNTPEPGVACHWLEPGFHGVSVDANLIKSSKNIEEILVIEELLFHRGKVIWAESKRGED